MSQQCVNVMTYCGNSLRQLALQPTPSRFPFVRLVTFSFARQLVNLWATQ